MVSKTHLGGGERGGWADPTSWASPLEAQSGPTLSPGACTGVPDFSSPTLAQGGYGMCPRSPF